VTTEPSVLDAFRFPSDWNRNKFRWIIENRKVLTIDDLPLLGANLVLGVTERFEGDGRPTASEDLSKYKVVGPGDVIMNPLGKPHGSIGRSSVKGITSPAYWVLRGNPELLVSKYLHYLLRSDVLINEYKRRSKNLPPNQFDLPWEQFRDFEVPLPPIEEQRRIADYLDEQVSRIDKLIRLREVQVESFWASVHSRLSDLFLVGLHGQIRLKRLIKDETLGIWGEEQGENPLDVYVARVADFDRKTFTLGSVETIRSIEPRQFVSRRVSKGDLLLERSGGGAKSPVGCAVYVEEDLPNLVSSNFVSRIRATSGVDARYLSLLFAALYANGHQTPHSSQTTGIQNLNTESYFQIEVPLLTESQQIEIMRVGENLIQSTDGTVKKFEVSTALLKEYKTSLITAAVTGQFDITTGRSVA
jgi:type I restriction enzyme S subunit